MGTGADIPVIILVGGLGTRLRAAVPDLPKPMAPVKGKPFLEYLVTRLVSRGFSRIILAVGYKGEMIESHFRDGARFHAAISYSREETPLGTGGAVREAMSLADAPDYLVMNGDTFVDVDFGALLSFHREKAALASITVLFRPDTSRFGTIEFDGDGRIGGFKEKASRSEGYINAGVYALSRQILPLMPEGPFSLEKDHFPFLTGRGFFALPMDGYFVDMGTPSDYHLLGRDPGAITGSSRTEPEPCPTGTTQPHTEENR